jgi:pyrroline-5-carboxylate reductase
VAQDELRIGFIGGGAMAGALIGGLLAAGVEPRRLAASEPLDERRHELESRFGITVLADNAALVARSDAVVLAVKPGMVEVVLEELRAGGIDCARPLWISIAAGVTLSRLEAGLSAGARVVRAMPNTPALVQKGATGLCGNAATRAEDLALASSLFRSVGTTWQAPREELLDAVTGLSGSGPAYVFAFLEALMDAGTAVGLPRDAAEDLVLQTVYGAVALARESGRSPAELRRQVSSPGGTTLAGLARLEARDFAGALRDAVEAATRRAEELGRGKG